MRKKCMTLILCTLFLLTSCSLPFGSSSSVDSKQIMHDLKEQNVEKVIDLYDEGYIPIKHRLTIEREAPATARILKDNIEITNTGLFEDMLTTKNIEDETKDKNHIYLDKITFNFSGVYNTSDQKAYGDGKKLLQFHELGLRDIAEEYPFIYQDHQYTLPTTNESLELPFLLESLRNMEELPPPKSVNNYTFTHTSLTEEDLHQIFDEQIKLEMDEFIDASIITTVSAKDPKRIDTMEVRMQWYASELDEQVRYTLSNYMLFMKPANRENIGLSVKEMYEKWENDMP